MVFVYIALGVFILLLTASFTAGEVLTNMIFHPRHFTWEQGKDHEREMGAWVEDEFEGLMAEGRVQRFTVEAHDGVQLNAAWVLPECDTDKAVVIMHGFGCCAVNSYKYAKLFLERGYAALIYDNRAAGESGGRKTTLGFNERWDLDLMVKVAREFAGADGIVGTHGESQGGATVIMEACRYTKPDFVVSDCPFADMTDEIAYAARLVTHLPKFPVVYAASLICRLRAGFFFSEVSPIRDLGSADGLIDTPVLFIHGTKDEFIPPENSLRLYEAKRGAKKRWLCEGAVHARSIVKDNAGYRRALNEFLDEFVEK